MEFKKISSPTLKELFVEEIESMILSGELANGEKLPPEREIAQQMQVSRSVVNDGIVEMARKGFLRIIPRQGTYVADYKKYGTIDILISIMKNGNVSNDYIRSTLELRNVFMDLALDTAIPNMQDKDIDELKQTCQLFQQVTSLTEHAETIFEFDHQLMMHCDNVLLPILFSSFKIPNVMLFERYFKLHGIEKMHQRNMLLLQCIERNDVQGAKAVMKQSIEDTIHGKTEIYTMK
ncbi:MAG: GntR family transcriptional regulator [Longicatena sp.]